MSTRVKSEDAVPLRTVPLRAPVEFFDRIDRWCQYVKERDQTVLTPHRTAAIRWIVDQFLRKEEALMARKKLVKKRRPAP
jgi:hypothetical protein